MKKNSKLFFLLCYWHVTCVSYLSLWGVELTAKPLVVVSFTTISLRIEQIKPMIESILSQSVKPDKFELYLSDYPYLHDEGIKSDQLPQFLKDYQTQGMLEIKYTKNTGPYRKLLPSLKKRWLSNDILITVDDDTLYPKTTIEQLLKYHHQYNCVVAVCGKTMTFENGEFGNYKKLTPYDESWPMSDCGKISLYEFPVGTGAVLYRPYFFSDKVFDEIFLEICPYHDDAWFKIMTLIKGISCCIIGTTFWGQQKGTYFPSIQFKRPAGELWPINLIRKSNESLAPGDQQIANIINWLGELPSEKSDR